MDRNGQPHGRAQDEGNIASFVLVIITIGEDFDETEISGFLRLYVQGMLLVVGCKG